MSIPSRRMRLRITYAIGSMTLMLAGTGVRGDENTINAQALTTYPPFEFKDENSGKVAGFNIDVLEAIAAKMGKTINWTETSYAQMISFAPLNTKRADILLGSMGDTPERRVNANFLDFVYSNQVFYTLGSLASRFSNMDALCGSRVGASRPSLIEQKAVETWSAENCVAAGKPPITMLLGEATPQVRLMVHQGRADAALTGAGVIAYQNATQGTQFAVIGKPATKLLTGYAFRKDDHELGQALKVALNAVIASGEYEKIMRKWGLTEDASIGQAMINGEP